MAEKQKCWWHPKRNATHIVNLGTAIDRDCPACDECVAKIRIIGGQFVLIEMWSEWRSGQDGE